MLSRNDIAQGDYDGAASALLGSIWMYKEGDFTTVAFDLSEAEGDLRLSGGEQALVWFARQIYNGDIQKHLANLDEANRRLLVEVLAGFAGVEL